MTSITSAGGFSIKRAARLTRWNAVLLTRNRLALVYAAVMPMLPLLLLFTVTAAKHPRARAPSSRCSW